MHTPRRRGIAAGAILGLVASPLAVLASTTAAQAAPSPGLVISEVYGGGGNSGAPFTNDFIELYNPTDSAISVAGMSVQYRSATGTSAQLTNLTGSVPARGHYLVQEAAGATPSTALPTPDATGAIAMGAGAGVVILASNTTAVTAQGDFALAPPANVIDTVGFGTTPTTFETTNTANATSATLSAQRAAAGTDTDANNPDFSELAPTPTNSTGSATGTLSATDPGDKTALTGTAITGFTLAAGGGTSPYSWTATGLPAGVTVAADGAVSGTPTAAGVYDVTATVTDSATPTPATATTSFTITVTDAPAAISIAEIQGTGDATPLSGQTVTTTGVVTASYPTGGLNGFYLQTPGADTPNASDAVFVYGGTSGFATYPAVGDSVQVTGTAGEFSGATQITATGAVTPVAALGTVTPKTQVPGTDCALPGTACLTGAALDQAREVAEGEAFRPTAPWTATDVYDFGPYYNDGSNSSAMRGEIGLAADSEKPLVAPTEIIDAQATALRNERIAYNNAHRIVLDDGASLTYSTTQNSASAFPWLTATHAPRVGAAVTFPAPVIFTFGFNQWRLQPTTQVVGEPTGTQPQFEQTRAENAAPQDVGGDLKLATFNVLNFFPTTGEEFVESDLGTCTYFTDRSGARISNNSCNPDGPRGAANEANLARQRAKIVAAINTAGADVVSLEELENSVKFGKPRDFAIDALVTALNAAAGAGTWAAVPSPAASELPPLAEQDVIRNGFIYKPAQVELVGGSDVLGELSTGTEPFGDAREPVAQAFKQVGTADTQAFAVIVNHFKSKGSGTPDPDGQGNANDRRVLQAEALVDFADDFKTARGISRVFLAGDFNAYSEEDPIQVLNAAGYTNLESTSDPEEESYNFDGQVGSLDHVLANEAALADVAAVDIWAINSYESVYYEYARYNTNVTDLYAPNPFRSSDHNPEIVGIDVAAAEEPATRQIQILGTNDFHGRILNNAAGAPGSPTGTPSGPNTSSDASAGAAILSGAVKQLRAENPDTVFAAAGDLIGASTFESFIQDDEPTIDALNAAGLDVSAAGNHEFDQGYEDLVGRVQARANWEYIAANVQEPTGRDDLAESWVKDFGDVRVGFVGAVTEDLPSLVSPDGIPGVSVTDIVAATNAEADVLEAAGADVIVLLVHEGAPNTNCATMDDDPTSAFGSIINGVDDNVDAIVSGHTHLAYNCSFPVAGWTGRPVTERPVVSAGQYGQNLNQLTFTVDTATGAVQAKTQAILALKANPTTPNYPADPAVVPIVDEAITEAGPLGAVPVGSIEAPFSRAKFANGTTENRGGESTLGNLVAEIQRWATRNPESGSAQIALMNPGGLRDDLVGTVTGGTRAVTYRQAANVQPFANTLVNMDLTGEQIETVLEQQWQLTATGTVPSRPFLKLGQSDGFEYTYSTSVLPTPATTDAPEATYTQGEVTSMKLNGVELVPAQVYSVTVNSFLASGGDNFRELNNGAGKQDTGKADLQAQVDYFEQVVGDTPLEVDYSQRAVGVAFPGQDSTVTAGEDISFELSSLIMTGVAGGVTDVKDTEVMVSLNGVSLGSFPVDTTVPNPTAGTAAENASTDESGKASVTVTIPRNTASGIRNLQVTGATTGTEVLVPITVEAGEKVTSTVTATVTPARVAVRKDRARVSVTVESDEVTPTGTVQVRGQGGALLGTGTLVNGAATITVGPWRAVGANNLTVTYSGDDFTRGGSDTVRVVVVKQTPSMSVAARGVVPQGAAPPVRVTLRGVGATVTGKVRFSYNGKSVVRSLRNGTVTLKLGKLRRTTRVTVRYLGSDVFTAAVRDKTIRVRR